MDGANWISLGSLAAAAVSAAVAVVQARRASAAKDAAEHYEARAEQNAERATKAAEDAAAWQRQTAEALEKQNRLVEERAEQAEGVPWEIRHHDGDLYDLWNITNTTKFGVQISGGGIGGGPLRFDRIDGRSSARFLIAPFGAEADRIDVTWHRHQDLSDEPRSWRGNRPPK